MKHCFLKTGLIIITAAAGLILFSCEKDDNGSKNIPRQGAFFISISGESAEYIMQAENIDQGEVSMYPNNGDLEMSGYTWIFNDNPSVAIGLIYNQGDPGIGLAYGVDTSGLVYEIRQFQISSRFTSYGFFGNYALTSVGGQTPIENGVTLTHPDGTERSDGVTFNFIDLSNVSLREKYMTTLDITGNGEQATLSGIVDMGDGTFLTGLVCSQARDESATGGSSSGTVTYPDSVWVARFDENLELKAIYRDNRISYSSGRYRSQYYSQIGKADDGTVYVFSGSYDYNNTATNLPCGALKINKNANSFDDSYYFNIDELTGGYRFRKVWHVTGNYFLLEIYNHTGRLGAVDDPATQYAVVDAKNKTLNWVGGQFPAKDNISSTGAPMAYNGKMYFPVTASGQEPAIYVIDPATGNATRGITITGAVKINAVGRLVE